MSSITNSLFSLHNPGMEANQVESKGGKKGDSSKGTPVIIVGPVPPKPYTPPDGVIYIYSDPPPPTHRNSFGFKSNNAELVSRASDEKARKAFNAHHNRRKNATKQYTIAHDNNSNHWLSSSSASAGSKSLALLSSASSGGKTQAVFSSKVNGGKSLV